VENRDHINLRYVQSVCLHHYSLISSFPSDKPWPQQLIYPVYNLWKVDSFSIEENVIKLQPNAHDVSQIIWETFFTFFPLQRELNKRKLSVISVPHGCSIPIQPFENPIPNHLVLEKLADKWLAVSISSKQKTQHCCCTSQITPLLHNSTLIANLSWSILHPNILIFVMNWSWLCSNFLCWIPMFLNQHLLKLIYHGKKLRKQIWSLFSFVIT